MLGPQIEKLDDHQLAALVEDVTIFAKLSPDQKARIVAALHAQGHVVGFLGDGINDSLALKAADVGISVDTAVDIAKESADIILLEKNLLILQQGVVEGRKVFGNIVKYIKMGASSNFGSMFSVLGASLFAPFLPMLPIQVLTNNLLYDFSQTAIPTDNVDEEYLAQPRKWDIGNIFKFMVLIGPISSIFDFTTFYVMTHVFDGLKDPALFRTGWFVEIPPVADLDHPCHPNRKDALRRQPPERGPGHHFARRLRDRRHSAHHAARTNAEIHAVAGALLAHPRLHSASLCAFDAGCEGLVRSTLGDLRRPAKSWGSGGTPKFVIVGLVPFNWLWQTAIAFRSPLRWAARAWSIS